MLPLNPTAEARYAEVERLALAQQSRDRLIPDGSLEAQ
jgi:hypothetical protein